MPLPVPNLDDRRFDDLVIEARQRLATHLPELTKLTPGDPVHSFIDLFAWLTETILYRANLIPERQRRVFLNLLQIPVRPARPAHGVVCIDARAQSVRLPALVREGSQLKGAQQSFSTVGELQPTPLQMSVIIKKKIDNETLSALGYTLQDLHEQHGMKSGEIPAPFQPRTFETGKETMSLADSLDKVYYLALSVPRPLEDRIDELRKRLAGITLNIAMAPADDLEGDLVDELLPRELIWELMSLDDEGKPLFLPLEVVGDSSGGGRRLGIMRLRLPRNPNLFKSLQVDDPMDAGLGERPPEPPAQVPSHRIVLWLRLRSREEPDLPMGYLGVNGIEVIGQGTRRDLMIGIGTGQPDQVLDLPDTNIGIDSIELDVEEDGAWVRWTPVDFLVGRRADERVYRLDSAAGHVFFGDGLNGRRPSEGRRIRIARYRHGGGTAGNLAAGEIKELSDGGAQVLVRHEWPCSGGLDAETVEQAERRIPEFLTHRNRAVTEDDFKLLCLSNPVNPVARAEVLVRFIPGASIRAARNDVPGAVSVIVLPPGVMAIGQIPKPTQGLLKDVFGYLLNRVSIGTELYVLSPEFVPLAVGVKVDVRDAQTEQQTLREVREAVLAFLWPLMPGGSQGQGWPLGGTVKASEILTQVARVPGVQAVNALSLFVRETAGWRRLKEGEVVELVHYQLPELLGVSATTGPGEPEFPEGIGQLVGGGGTAGPQGGQPENGRQVPAPVIPDIC